jgi:flagellar basal body rod protein FlgG
MPIPATTSARSIDPRSAPRAMAFAMHGLEKRFESIASNLANAETTGHKRLIARSELFTQELASAKATDGTVVRDFTQGDLLDTGDPMDVAIDGPGFFAVEQNGQTQFTRALHLHAEPDGTLVDEHGGRVLGEGGPLRLGSPTSKFEVQNDGTVKGDGADVGRLRLVNFVEPQRLDDATGGYWRADDRLEVTGAQGAQVRQRQRERSNVNALDELVNLITVQRQYEAAQRALSVESELRHRLNDGLR